MNRRSRVTPGQLAIRGPKIVAQVKGGSVPTLHHIELLIGNATNWLGKTNEERASHNGLESHTGRFA